MRYAYQGGEGIAANIPPTCLSPIFSSLPAARFFFTPVLEEVEKGSSKAITIEVYTKMIVRLLLQGITGPDNETVKLLPGSDIYKKLKAVA